MNEILHDIISIDDLPKEVLLKFLDLAEKIEQMSIKEKSTILENKVISTLFFEPSTRTKLSFESAALQLGAKVLPFPDTEKSSVKKGESFTDTIIMVDGYSDMIVIRHPLDGAARLASEVSNSGIINAGDGSNQHPSQTLLDLFTIYKEKNTLDDLNIAFVGDLKYGRTVHSLTKAISLFSPKIYFVSPENLRIPKAILSDLDEEGVFYKELEDFREVLPEIDILYMTRIQKERFPDLEEYEKVKNVYVINRNIIEKNVKDDFIIMHPLPRVGEIDTDLDDTKYALYFKQAKNGIPMRQAMMIALLHEKGIDF